MVGQILYSFKQKMLQVENNKLHVWGSRVWNKTLLSEIYKPNIRQGKILLHKMESCYKSLLRYEILGERPAVWWAEGRNWRRCRFLLFLPHWCLYSSQDFLSRSFVISRVAVDILDFWRLDICDLELTSAALFFTGNVQYFHVLLLNFS